MTGPGGDRAVAAALAHVGGGVAQGVEYEDDAGVSWEVEVVTRDGRRLEVLVGHRFAVVRVESEDEDSGRADDD